MTEEKEYIVSIKNPDDWDQFHEEMIQAGNYPAAIPDRAVTCADERPGSPNQSHYILSADEAAALKNDPRVICVEWNPDHDPDLIAGPVASLYQRFDQSNTLSADMKNWGLLRSTNVANPFATSNNITTNFNYTLTGNGVDVVIIDSGVAEGHPELAVNIDGTGGSRVVDFNWDQFGILPRTNGQPTNYGGSGINGYLGDCDGHGTNCATICIGNTCGWARNASLYVLRCISSATNKDIVTGATLSQIPTSIAFDLVRAFHLAKPIQSNGYRRPTICTNSWTFYATYTNMQQTSWRGTTYTTTSRNTTYGQVNANHVVRVSSIDVSIANAIAAGVIVVGAAGNFSHKCEVEGGIDYNNWWFNGSTYRYYHRGGTPGCATAQSNGVTYRAITVGALDAWSVERKASYSETGPRLNIYAPGTYIVGGGSTNYTNVNDPRNSVYKLSKLSGTSMACPQVAGVLACAAEIRPWMNQSSALGWLNDNSINNVLNEYPANGQSYTNYYYLQGSTNKILFMPFNRSENITMTGDLTINVPMETL